MNVSFYIARRYLFSKKSHNAINIISLVAMWGIAVVTMATVCAMSIFNGFHDIAYSSFGTFEPDLKVLPTKGKVFDPTTEAVRSIYSLDGVDVVGEVLEEMVLVNNDRHQSLAVAKGVSSNFEEWTRINDIIYSGEYLLKDEVNNYALVSVGLSSRLGIYANQRFPLDIYTFKRDVPVNMVNPVSSLAQDYVYVSSLFMVGQEAYDENYVIVPIELLREIFNYPKEVSALEIKLIEGASSKSVQKEIRRLLGDDFVVKDRYEQQEAAFRMINIEKWITFLILCFIILIAVFNIIGSLSMLIVDKQGDIRTLQSLGANNRLISHIFLFEGWMISALGCLIGTVLGVFLCFGQQQFGWLQMGTPGSFAVSAYPVVIKIKDLLIILTTGLVIGYLAVLSPVRYLSKKWLRS